MHWGRVAVATVGVAVLAGCTALDEPSPRPSPSVPSPEPTVSATPPTSEPTDPLEPTADVVAFGVRDFDGFPVGSPLGQFAEFYQGYADGCGPEAPVRFARESGPPEDNPWVLWVGTEEFEDQRDTSAVAWFGIEATWSADLSSPFGPEGPYGLRLGTTEADLWETHPEAPVREYLAEYYNETYLLYTVDADTEFPIVYAVRDGVIVDIRWGSPRVAVDWEHQFCSEGDAPFDW